MRRRAPGMPGSDLGGIRPEVARIIVAIARDMARADHELEIRAEKSTSRPCNPSRR